MPHKIYNLQYVTFGSIQKKYTNFLGKDSGKKERRKAYQAHIHRKERRKKCTLCFLYEKLINTLMYMKKEKKRNFVILSIDPMITRTFYC